MFTSLLIANRKHDNWRAEVNHFRHDITNDPYKNYSWAYTIAYGIEMQHYYTYGKLPRGRYRVNVSDIVETMSQMFDDMRHGVLINNKDPLSSFIVCDICHCLDKSVNGRYDECYNRFEVYFRKCYRNISECIPKIITETLKYSNYTATVSDDERIRVYKIDTAHTFPTYNASVNRLYTELENSNMMMLMLDMAPENQLKYMYNDTQRWGQYKFPEYTARQGLDSFFPTNDEEHEPLAAYDLPGYLHLYSWIVDVFENSTDCIDEFFKLNDIYSAYKDYFMKNNSANSTTFYLDLLENFSIFTQNNEANLKNPMNPITNQYFTANRTSLFDDNVVVPVLVAGKTNYKNTRQFWQHHFVSNEQYKREFYDQTFENAFEVINPLENSTFRYDDNIPESRYQQTYNSYEEIIPDYESFANISYWHFPTNKCIVQDTTGGIMTTVDGMHELLDKIPAYFAIPYLNPHVPLEFLFSNFSVVDVTPGELRNVIPEPLPESSSYSESSSTATYTFHSETNSININNARNSSSTSSKTGVIVACSVVGGVILIGGIIAAILLTRKYKITKEASEAAPDDPDAGNGSVDSFEV